MKRGRAYDWIPLWIDKWLMGSTRFELEPAERAVFIDLLVLAAKDDGYVRANDNMPYPLDYLAHTLNITIELLRQTLDKCIKLEKVKDIGGGVYYITNWQNYILSVRHKKRVTTGKCHSSVTSCHSSVTSCHSTVTSPPYNPPIYNSNSNNIISKKNNIKNNIIYKNKNNIIFDNRGVWGGITEDDKKIWAEAFPACDIETELKRMASWLVANPTKQKKNYRRFIHNWLTRTQDKGGTKKKQSWEEWMKENRPEEE